MADDKPGWRPPDSKHPWVPPEENDNKIPPDNGWHPSRVTGYLIVIALVIWSLGAFQWKDKDCNLAESYKHVITDGFPESYDGCHPQDP